MTRRRWRSFQILSNDAAPNTQDWLDKDFFHVEKPETIEVTFPEATNSWKLTRESESAQWQLAQATPEEKLDSSKTSGVASPFSSASFQDVLPNVQVGGGTNQPTVVKIHTFDNFDYTVKVGAKTNNDYLLAMNVSADLPKERTPGKDEKPEDKAKLDKEFKDKQQKLEDKLKKEQSYGKWTYLVSSWTVDPLLKHRNQLLEEKKEDTKKQASNVGSAEKVDVKQAKETASANSAKH